MPLTAGTRIGIYEVISPIGAGGMGEVYRAKDTRLKREVALKVLPESFASDPDRMARFQREAEVLASLNHPNIAQIYGVEERAIAMELVAGEMLRGPVPVEVALGYARQVAEALEAAHEKGIVHRDLKPGNVMVTPDGVVKVLDFGLAKAAEESSGRSDATNSPTLTMSPTRAGMILGTAAYMAPEQARGQLVDRRADIWAFGCLLFELITGKQAFAGESVADILSAVLKSEPDLSLVPVSARRLVARCLVKDKKQRLQAIGDARIAIDEILSGALTEPAAAVAPAKRGWLVSALAAALALVAGAGWWWAVRPVEKPVMQLSLDLGPDAVAGQYSTVAISPDGKRLVFPIQSDDGKQMLATRLISEGTATPVAGTENGRDPFFSPDGQALGFFADGKLKKVGIHGGAATILCDAIDGRGGSWGADGEIFANLNSRGPIWQLPADGRSPHSVTKLAGALSHRWPQALPGSKAVLFTASPSNVSSENASIAALDLKRGEVKVLLQGGYFGRYLATWGSTGHLVYVHRGVLFAAPFDPGRLALLGPAVPVLDDLASDAISGGGQFDSSGGQAFAYRTGKMPTEGWPIWWLAGDGRVKPLIANPSLFTAPRLSPDGHKLAISPIVDGRQGISVYDLGREQMTNLLPSAQRASYPNWSPDGKHLVFWFSSSGGYSIGWIREDGSGDIQRLLEGKNLAVPYAFFPDGRRLAYYEIDSDTGGTSVWTLPLDVSDPEHPKAGKPEPFLSAQARSPAVSADGRWIAYQSDQSGKSEIYVRPFPGPGGKWQISTGGGADPIFSRNGRELFFQNPEGRIMVLEYRGTVDSFNAGKPRVWAEQRLQNLNGVRNYDLAPDGKQFAIIPRQAVPGEDKGTLRVHYVVNFFELLREKAPVGK